MSTLNRLKGAFVVRSSALENLKGVKSRADVLDFTLLEPLDSARTQNIPFWLARHLSTSRSSAKGCINNQHKIENIKLTITKAEVNENGTSSEKK